MLSFGTDPESCTTKYAFTWCTAVELVVMKTSEQLFLGFSSALILGLSG